MIGCPKADKETYFTMICPRIRVAWPGKVQTKGDFTGLVEGDFESLFFAGVEELGDQGRSRQTRRRRLRPRRPLVF